MSQYLQENTCVNEIAGLLAVPQNVLGRPLKTFIKPFEVPQGGPQLLQKETPTQVLSSI